MLLRNMEEIVSWSLSRIQILSGFLHASFQQVKRLGECPSDVLTDVFLATYLDVFLDKVSLDFLDNNQNTSMSLELAPTNDYKVPVRQGNNGEHGFPPVHLAN